VTAKSVRADRDAGPELGTGGRLGWSSALFALSAAVQGLGGAMTGSLGLVSDSLENLNDLIANLLALTTLTVANRRAPSDRFTYGWHRLEVFNTFLGAMLLLVLAGGVVVEAVRRLRHPAPIQTGWVLVFCLSGLALNVGAALVLRPRDASRLERDANLKAAYYHAFSDSFASMALVASALAIRATGWRWLDPLVALGIVVVIVRSALVLLRDATSILMHRAAFDHGAAVVRLRTLPGVVDVDDLRSWRVCSHLVVCSAHVVVDVERLDETPALLAAIEDLLAREFGVRHATLHFETPGMAAGHHHLFLHQHDLPEAHDHGHDHGHDHDHDHGQDHDHDHGHDHGQDPDLGHAHDHDHDHDHGHAHGPAPGPGQGRAPGADGGPERDIRPGGLQVRGTGACAR
jgi:cobalt-zinc-cadmium efflux system protein